MSANVYKSMMNGVGRHPAVTRDWLVCESAIVTDTEDPDKLGRIKAIIPCLDPDMQFDDWIVPAGFHCLGDGFGSLFLPEKGSEVLVTGKLAQKYNLVYHAAVYNEEMAAAAELNADWPGIKTPKNLTFIATLVQKLVAQNMQIVVEQLCKIEAANIHSLASALNKMEGQNATVEADQTVAVMGNTVTIHSDGSMTIQANGNISVSANGNVAATATGNMTLQGRTVNKVGPPI